MKKDIEKIIINYKIFRKNMEIALSVDDSILARIHSSDAGKALDEIYSLMPKKEFSKQFPKTYTIIENIMSAWNTRPKKF